MEIGGGCQLVSWWRVMRRLLFFDTEIKEEKEITEMGVFILILNKGLSIEFRIQITSL